MAWHLKLQHVNSVIHTTFCGDQIADTFKFALFANQTQYLNVSRNFELCSLAHDQQCSDIILTQTMYHTVLLPGLQATCTFLVVYLLSVSEEFCFWTFRLIFSQSILSLNIIESFLEVVDSKYQQERESLTEEEHEKEMFGRSWTKNLDYYRMDGSTSAQNRQLWASNFNDIENYRSVQYFYCLIFYCPTILFCPVVQKLHLEIKLCLFLLFTIVFRFICSCNYSI